MKINFKSFTELNQRGKIIWYILKSYIQPLQKMFKWNILPEYKETACNCNSPHCTLRLHFNSKGGKRRLVVNTQEILNKNR